MAGLEVNWAKIIFGTLVKDRTSFLPYGAFLSHVFRKFHIDLASETSVVKVFKPFDRAVLHRMKLHDFSQPTPQLQPQHQPSPPPQSSTQVTSSSSHPPFTESTFSQPPPSFLDAFYNSISAEILTLQAQQTSMLNCQSALLTNQSLFMEHFMNM